jgi:ribonuclease VapC
VIIDTSAIMAILFDEPEAPAIASRIESEEGARLMGAVNYLEAAIIVDRDPDPANRNKLDRILANMDITVEPLTETQVRRARQAYRDFGKGSGSKAKLNLGDCLAYALSVDKRQPLLYKGNDFVHTDVESAL